ncbi:MAG: dihydrofolate reductase family protein [Caldilineales bacterium]|nr:dihydrofolate reductase family protein [Caldilineales bacterium]
MRAHEELAALIAASRTPGWRPLVTLSYAQSLDGSITLARGAPLALSGEESLLFTHGLRAAHDAILVGIGTVLADDPQLTVRRLPGKQPQPVVFDTHLRTPVTARLLDHPHKPWLLAGPNPDPIRRSALENAGARVIIVRTGVDGRLDLPAALAALRKEGIETLMVEGGAQILSAFLKAKLADWLATTICPRLIGGLAAVESLPMLPNLTGVTWRQAGADMLCWARLEWEN